MKIEMIEIGQLQKPEWHSTYILRPDLLVLSSSLMSHGFVSPIVVQKQTNIIIDGYQRWMLAKELSELNKILKGLVPVVYMECDSLEAMLMHLQINRGKGSLLAHKVSSIIRDLFNSGRYSEKDFDKLLTMKYDELEVLFNPTILKQRKISEHKYSRAWVPIEAPVGTVDNIPTPERPPNADR